MVPDSPKVETTRGSTHRREHASWRSSALTRDKVQTPATARVSPENALSEGSQPPQATRCIPSFPPSVLHRRSHTERRWSSRDPGEWGAGVQAFCFWVMKTLSS